MGVVTVMNFQSHAGRQGGDHGRLRPARQGGESVAKTLRQHGVDVTAIHNHALMDVPRLFCMHFWANDDPSSWRGR
jgi:hypothetical protein